MIECDEGWRKIIDKFVSDVEALPFDTGFKLKSAGEKWGGIRLNFIYDYGHGRAWIEINRICSEAVAASYHTCEICGQHGELRKGSWWKTLCDPHHQERQSGVVPVSKKEEQQDD